MKSPSPPPDQTLLLEGFLHSMSGHSNSTVDAYGRVLRQLAAWLEQRPGGEKGFRPDLLTATALQTYLAQLASDGYSVSHRARVKAVVSRYSRWLIEEHGLLRRNPARQVSIPAQPLLAPRELSPDQRYVLRNLVERAGDPRGEAIFALGYWAGCRVSDVAWLRVAQAHVGPKTGWLEVGHKGGKVRSIDLVNEARRPIHHYMQEGGRDPDSPFVFTSQRASRLTEAGIHHWFRNLRAQATRDEWELVHDVTFHDLRHDFAHRARSAGWTIEEIAYYLGHITRMGMPAIQTTARYTQVSREQIKGKLRLLEGGWR